MVSFFTNNKSSIILAMEAQHFPWPHQTMKEALILGMILSLG